MTSSPFTQWTEEVLWQQAQIIDQIHEAVISMDLNGYVTGWNKGAERLFGYLAQEALGRHISFVYPEDQHTVLHQEIIKSLLEKGNYQTEVRMRRQSGEEFYAYLSLSLLRASDGTVTGMIGYSKDITSRKQTERELQTRIQQQATVVTLGQLALTGIDLSELMEKAVALVAQTLAVDYCKILELLSDEQTFRLRAGAGWKEGAIGQAIVDAGRDSQAGYTLLINEPVIVEDLRTETRFRGPKLLEDHQVVSGLSVPIYGQKRPFGVLGVHTRKRRFFTTDDVHFVQAIANVLAEAVERKQAEEQLQHSHEQLRALAAHLQSIREEERGRIAREIHDELGQALTALKMDLVWIKKKLSTGNERSSRALLTNKLHTMSMLVDSTIHSVRRIATELRPGLLDDLGLVPALEWQAREFQTHTGIRYRFLSCREEIALEEDRAVAIFRIFQEALTNVVRHSQATMVEISLQEEAGGLMLEIKDNGRGIPESKITDTKSIGLIGMRERALLLGGNLTIRGIPEQGTIITTWIPLHRTKQPGELS